MLLVRRRRFSSLSTIIPNQILGVLVRLQHPAHTRRAPCFDLTIFGGIFRTASRGLPSHLATVSSRKICGGLRYIHPLSFPLFMSFGALYVTFSRRSTFCARYSSGAQPMLSFETSLGYPQLKNPYWPCSPFTSLNSRFWEEMVGSQVD